MEQRYSLTAVTLHWVLVLLIFALYGLGWYMVGFYQ
jgi:cytochrome b561